jgi:hypothetical protein
VIGETVSVFDEALGRVSALDYGVSRPFVNHGPMACEALSALGFGPSIDDWVPRFESSMEALALPAVPGWSPPSDWREAVGDPRLLPQWIGYFERVIEDDGWPSVVSRWVPRFMPGLVAALFHGVIRTSHAVRAIEAVDTPARRAELAWALASWATWLGSGEAAGDADIDAGAAHAAAVSAAHGARCYVTAPTIFHLHGVTGAMAVQLLAGHLTEAEGLAAVRQLRAEHAALFHGVTPWSGGVGAEQWDDGVELAASQSYDSHQIKLVEACRRGFAATGDRSFVAAATTVTSSGRR